MDTYIIQDIERIRSCGAFPSFAFANDGTVRWHTDNCTHKFVVVDSVLVIVAVNDHSTVYAIYCNRGSSLDENLPVKVKIITDLVWQRQINNVSGAGQINKDGVVTNWKSTGFNITTSKQDRESIQEEITRLYESGALTPCINN